MPQDYFLTDCIFTFTYNQICIYSRNDLRDFLYLMTFYLPKTIFLLKNIFLRWLFFCDKISTFPHEEMEIRLLYGYSCGVIYNSLPGEKYIFIV